jgi:hypothetical protein
LNLDFGRLRVACGFFPNKRKANKFSAFGALSPFFVSFWSLDELAIGRASHNKLICEKKYFDTLTETSFLRASRARQRKPAALALGFTLRVSRVIDVEFLTLSSASSEI